MIKADYENLVECYYGFVDEHRNSSAAWLTTDSAAADVRKLRDGAGGTIGAPLWSPSVQVGQPDLLLGAPA